MATKTYDIYERTHKKLEMLRQESGTARTKLISAIMCDKKDVLALSDIKEIEKALAGFLKVQRQLGQAWFQDGNAVAKLMGLAGRKSLEEAEALLG